MPETRYYQETLSNRAETICNKQYLDNELKHIQTAFLKNGYTLKEIKRATRPNSKTTVEPTVDTQTKAFLEYIPKITDRIGKILRRHNIKTIFKPSRKLQHTLRSAKDYRDPKTAGGVYRNPCSCGKVYIGTTKRSINTRIGEHRRHCNLKQAGKSSVAEHVNNNPDHTILFDQAVTLSTTQHYFTRLYREAIEIQKHPFNINKQEDSVQLKGSWLPAIKGCRSKKTPLTDGQPRRVTVDESRSETAPTGSPPFGASVIMPTKSATSIATSGKTSQSEHRTVQQPAYLTRSVTKRQSQFT